MSNRDDVFKRKERLQFKEEREMLEELFQNNSNFNKSTWEFGSLDSLKESLDIEQSSNFSQMIDIVNHPVHIVDKNNKMMPSAFIPFCSIGLNFTKLGQNIPKFSHPVCSMFQSKMLNGQMCYQLDINEVQEDVSFKKGETNGLTFLMDYNEDKMVNEHVVKTKESDIDDLMSTNEATIYVDTLGQ